MFVIKIYALKHFKRNATYILGAYLALATLVNIICPCLIFSSNKDKMIPRALQTSNETQLFVSIITTHAHVNTRVESCTRDACLCRYISL